MAVEIKKNQLSWYRPVHKSKWKGLSQTWPKGTLYRLWDPNKDIKHQPSIEWYGGIDVHLKELTVALFGIDLDQGVKKILGPIITVRTTLQGYQKLFELYDFFSPIRILMETTGVYSIDPYHRCVAQYPAEGGENRVICMNAHDLSRLLVKNKKMDRIDAARLAFLASIPELLRESYIPTREEYVLRFMLRQRNRYKKDLTKTKNRIKTFLAAGGLKWRFNFKVKGEIGVIKGFIEQTKDLGDYLIHLDTSLDIDKHVKSTIQKHGKKLAQWADFTLSDMERLNLIALVGFMEKMVGLVEMYDKLVYETLINISRFQKLWNLLQDMPGAGTWILATIILESGPISRFPRVGSYLSYVGVTKGIHESANKSKKKGNNPHSHRILKHAYRTMGISLLGMVIRAERADDNIIFQKCHPLIEYARRINMLPILNGQKANKIAAKAARIVYGILKSKKSYDCLHERKQTTSLVSHQDKFARVVRHSMMESQIDLLRTSYQTIVEKNGLLEEPYMVKLLACCKKVISLWDSAPLLSELRKNANSIRTVKRHAKASVCNRKKSISKVKALRINERKNAIQGGKEE